MFLLTENIFAMCLIAFWHREKIKRIERRGPLCERLAEAFNKARPLFSEEWRPGFRIHLDPIHGTSSTINQMFNYLVFVGRLGHYHMPDDGYLYLDMNDEAANMLLEGIPETVQKIIKQIARESIGLEPAA